MGFRRYDYQGPGGGVSAHKTTHQDGGTDEISVEGLSGLLATAQTPATHTHAEADVTNLVSDLAAKVPTSRTISTTAPLAGGGDLSANRTLTISAATTSAVGVVELATDGESAANVAVQGNDARMSNARTPTSHTHPESEITNLTTDLAAKAPLSHTHALADITDEGALAALNTVGTAQIDADSVTNTKLANVSTSTIKGRITGGTGDPEDLTAANVRTIINVADGANNYVHPNHSGDVTSVADGAQTIANDAVTYAKMQNVSAASKLLGRGDSGAGDPQEIMLGTNLSIAGTTLNATGGGGAATITTVEKNLGATPVSSGLFVVTDAGVSASSKIIIQQAPGPYTGKGTLADEAGMDEIVVYAQPGSGQFTGRWHVRPTLAMRAVSFDGQTRAPVTTAFNAADQPRARTETVRLGKVKGNFKFHYMVG